MIALLFLASFPIALACGVWALLSLRERRHRRALLLLLPTTFPLLIALGFARYDNRWHFVDANCPVGAQEVVGAWRGRSGEVRFEADGGALTGDGARWQWKWDENGSNQLRMNGAAAGVPPRCWVAMCRRGAVFLLPVGCSGALADPDTWRIGEAYERVR